MQNRIKELRHEKRLTLDEMAAQTGIKRGTLNNYENGKTEPKLVTWQSLADFFDVSISYLQGLTNINEKSGFDILHELAKKDSKYTDDRKDALLAYLISDAEKFVAIGNILFDPNTNTKSPAAHFKKIFDNFTDTQESINIVSALSATFFLELDASQNKNTDLKDQLDKILTEFYSRISN